MSCLVSVITFVMCRSTPQSESVWHATPYYYAYNHCPYVVDSEWKPPLILPASTGTENDQEIWCSPADSLDELAVYVSTSAGNAFNHCATRHAAILALDPRIVIYEITVNHHQYPYLANTKSPHFAKIRMNLDVSAATLAATPTQLVKTVI